MKSVLPRKLVSHGAIAACLVAAMGSTAVAQETLTFAAWGANTATNFAAVGDREGHIVGIATIAGLAITDEGEYARLWFAATFDYVAGIGPVDSYASLSFLDGSALWMQLTGTSEPEGATRALAGAGQILGGTGRYEGATGTVEYVGNTIASTEQGGGTYYRVTVTLN